MKTPTEVQADMIIELEAKVSLLLDDLFYARAEIAKMPSDIYLCPPTSENDYEGLKWCDAYEELERENAALRADKERLDWLESLHSLWEGTEKTGPVFLTRAAIDAARKEAK